MCGICGILNTGSNKPISEEMILDMTSVIRHRGPDDEGSYLGWGANGRKHVALGVRRLSIIDLKTGHQPIHNEDRSIWIVCNGEIYNFMDLRKQLQEKGHYFYTSSDIETIVHLYESYDLDSLKELRGMFAFALWDERKRRLFLARDRLGQKPLCYMEYDGRLIFASEIKSILNITGVPREVNTEAIAQYLIYKYVPSPLTAFKQIKKLPPAHYLLWEKNKLLIERYWNLNPASKLKMTEREYIDNIQCLLEEATRLRLISDVPLGAFLSGGVDSSIIVGLMSKFMHKPVKTFSIGFEEKAYDELRYARIAAEHFKTEHHEYVVRPRALEVLPKLIWHYNEPFADSSSIPTYYVAKMTRQEVTVALNGDGGDENFAGYPRYKAVRLAEYCEMSPGWVCRKVLPGLSKLISHCDVQKSFPRRLKKLLQSINLDPEERYLEWISLFNNATRNSLYTSSFKKAVRQRNSCDLLNEYYRRVDSKDFLDRTLFVDIMTYLPDDLLVKMDIATMANSLEARSPFLDHKLMEFTARIPCNLKLKRFYNSKYILKKSFSDLLPARILHRRKMGFGVPIGRWFRNELKEYTHEILLSRKSLERGYFHANFLKDMIEEHCSGTYDHGERLWALLNLELWHRMFIDSGQHTLPDYRT